MAPVIVAHRGDAARYLENTLAAFSSAADLGLRHVELDVQLTSDGVPLVLHDASAGRTHGVNVDVRHHSFVALARLGLFDPASFPNPIPQLDEFVTWMTGQPHMHAFVEIKKESLHVYGRRRVLATVERDIEAIRERATLISYDARVLALARRNGWPVGYVLETMSARWRGIAERLAPEFLFAEVDHLLRAGKLWPGAWQWAAFEVETTKSATALSALGVRYLETMNPALFKLL
ncbi:MAG: glycerophosphodiester phosphodiesterase family protein [Gammaproteobacteria bacterium]